MNYWYRAYGLTLQSEIACPELPEIDATTSPDVVIRLVQSIASTTGIHETHFSDIADVPLDVVAFDALPLGSVFNLQPRRDVDPPAIVALSSRETLEMLLRNTYRPRLLRRLGNPGHHMMRLVAAAGQASGFEFHRPWNLDRLDACGDTLVSHLATTIPTGAAA